MSLGGGGKKLESRSLKYKRKSHYFMHGPRWYHSVNIVYSLEARGLTHWALGKWGWASSQITFQIVLFFLRRSLS